jgi:hypothetical protein
VPVYKPVILLFLKNVSFQIFPSLVLAVFAITSSGVPRGEVAGVQPLPPKKFRSFDKAEPNSQFHGRYTHNNLIRIQVSLICKLSGIHD